MKIKYKEFKITDRGDVDIMPEQVIECISYKEVAENILKLLNVKDGWEIKITNVELEN